MHEKNKSHEPDSQLTDENANEEDAAPPDSPEDVTRRKFLRAGWSVPVVTVLSLPSTASAWGDDHFSPGKKERLKDKLHDKFGDHDWEDIFDDLDDDEWDELEDKWEDNKWLKKWWKQWKKQWWHQWFNKGWWSW